jgi:transposase
LDEELEALVDTLPGAKEMKAIKGVGSTTFALFFAEVGDIPKSNHPQIAD